MEKNYKLIVVKRGKEVVKAYTTEKGREDALKVYKLQGLECKKVKNTNKKVETKVPDWISKKKKVVYEAPLELSQEEIREIKELLAARKKQPEISRYPKDDEIKNRSVLVYKAAFDEFAQWAKEHKLTQAEALYLATQKLMQEYEE